MKPLFHPAVEDIRPEMILHALADPERALICARIGGVGAGGTCSANAHNGDRVIPKSSLSAHIKVLREAGLIRCERHGVEMRNHPRCGELDQHLVDLVKSIFAAYGWYYADRRMDVPSLAGARTQPEGRLGAAAM
jgi:DNA-binding transcriptional ArsR family regulator